MAKKKAKSKGNLDLILKVVILAFGVLALAMAFVTAVKFVSSDGDLYKAYSGFQAMFGYAETKTVLGSSVTTKHLAFSILSTLAFVLPVVGAVLSLLKNKWVRLAGAVLMIVGAVLIFLVPTFTVLAKVDGNFTAVSLLLDACERSLGIGAILGGIFAALGGLVSGYTLIKK